MKPLRKHNPVLTFFSKAKRKRTIELLIRENQENPGDSQNETKIPDRVINRKNFRLLYYLVSRSNLAKIALYRSFFSDERPLTDFCKTDLFCKISTEKPLIVIKIKERRNSVFSRKIKHLPKSNPDPASVVTFKPKAMLASDARRDRE